MQTTHARPFINFISHPPWVVTSLDFNETPSSIHLAGVRESNQHFFEQLEEEPNPKRRGEMLHEYMSVKFALHQWEDYHASARKSLRNSYVRFLRGWGVDSNSIEGAVLKGWVLSRFGVPPTFHKGLMKGNPFEDNPVFAIDLIRGSARTNAINSQFDLIFEFCQYELQRRLPGENSLILYRGTHDPEEYKVIDSNQERRKEVIQLNNISSFTSDREKAWEFGSTVWEVKVPLVKIVFYSDLLPDSLLKGEDEYLLIGGRYTVRKLLW
ncbi:MULTISPECIES: NAD(+)--dinitrogen-reductase ADP-D-ribosyltransferase [unclassified Lentimonas]|uniref:NAD(+)--dinitrogen-reductase ADP-D-ribosyltransferase n=1 Tax=unclassified Lentimonas TaxID=2630993 RepID=UPI00132475BB|nr:MULTISPECIES: NAD(+)--dinitrogen-reductase ADP-D-ribosyltransferase [unclassified Lentimonas]CAA6677158.1 NAD(+)--dinitrogen-reductase ADP-D-ribosyltransferase (EC [Lentimonas sp. CC4]CAA6686218.1 NAD(+)--dinitrogen-reductase ADP-D-ribosyltransferase (EC [Lentimonas sp. CC6]CAA7074248.1 NAD(+)--dinitrogen-reductase ADP-D-ribosyltransferase (EC [Lentimonas sp. CC4]CAA7171079.1 NAD(+)--dinitrogen-reductase ADP-D-ribosyltransferase (EC [Lentimonas sp. CC21]CAA7182881.1 NAD(+)--dinitrogen-reduc